jgi:hypothetical protein
MRLRGEKKTREVISLFSLSGTNAIAVPIVTKEPKRPLVWVGATMPGPEPEAHPER